MNSTNKFETIDEITQQLLDRYCGRKQIGRIDFVVDVSSGRFYPVPRDIEHKDFTPQIAKGRPGYVPSQLRLRKASGRYDLLELLVGASSYEATTEVRHTPEDLIKAFNLTWELINKSQIINPTTCKRQKIIHTYQQKVKS